jgi:hypothetical protein
VTLWPEKGHGRDRERRKSLALRNSDVIASTLGISKSELMKGI